METMQEHDQIHYRWYLVVKRAVWIGVKGNRLWIIEGLKNLNETAVTDIERKLTWWWPLLFQLYLHKNC